jgi:peptidoglycan/xylan/chitin deacetylase (PgdA/CDA1 family)
LGAESSLLPFDRRDSPDHDLFGQPNSKQEKLRNLIHWGCEVGSHTVTHPDLKKASAQEATKQLAESKATLEQLIGGGYTVTSLSVPFGDYPTSDALLAGGTYQGQKYAYTAAVAVGGGPSLSPFSTGFIPLHIKRIQVIGNALKNALNEIQKHPELRYVSDDDPHHGLRSAEPSCATGGSAW